MAGALTPIAGQPRCAARHAASAADVGQPDMTSSPTCAARSALVGPRGG